MKSTSLNLTLGLAMLLLVGCEAAEDSAQRLVEETKKEAGKLLDDAVGETVDQFNQQVDSLQASADEVLGREKSEQDEEQQRDSAQDEQDTDQE